MPDFTIWARVIPSSPQEFTVVATAIAFDGENAGQEVIVRTCTSRQAAEELRDGLAQELGAAVMARGDSVVNLEVE
jgi:hypothetical protein